MTAPKPGIHFDVPAETYYNNPAWDLMSAHKLIDFMRCPMRARWQQEHSREPTAAMLLGNVIHCSVFEPQEFDKRYVVRDKPDRRTKAGKAAWVELQKTVKGTGARIILPHDYDLAMWMRDSVLAHPVAGKLLATPGNAEVTVVWEEPAIAV